MSDSRKTKMSQMNLSLAQRNHLRSGVKRRRDPFKKKKQLDLAVFPSAVPDEKKFLLEEHSQYETAVPNKQRPNNTLPLHRSAENLKKKKTKENFSLSAKQR